MATRKTTLIIDSDDLEEARRLTDSPSASATVAAALRQLIRAERLQRDLRAYGVVGPLPSEVGLAALPVEHRDLVDDTDWEALYDDVPDQADAPRG